MGKIKKVILIFFIIAIFAKLSISDYNQDISREQTRLEDIRAKLKEKRAQRKEAAQKEQSILQKLQDAQEEISLIQLLLIELDKKEKRTVERIEETTKELEEAEKKLLEQQELMRLRLREIYKYYQINEIEALLTAESFTEIIERQRYLELLAQQDQKLYEEIEANKIKIERKKERLESNLLVLSELKEEQKAEKQTALAEKEKVETILTEVRTQKAAAEAAIRELEKAQAEIQSVIDRLEKERKQRAFAKDLPKSTGNHYLDKNRGKVLWPVSGKIVSKFGLHQHPVFRTQTFNKGIDISASKNTSIKSIADGTVVYVSWFRGYGKYLIIDHGEGYYSLYAHCSSITVKVNEQVNLGQTIAYVGDTGSLIGDALHFELRKNGEPVDPLIYLK